MSEKAGTLRMTPSGRWVVDRPGRWPVEITSGEPFRVEVDGEIRLTRMEFRHFNGGGGEYYSVHGYPLRDGLRAAFGAED
jgi:hypothetical protein